MTEFLVTLMCGIAFSVTLASLLSARYWRKQYETALFPNRNR